MSLQRFSKAAALLLLVQSAFAFTQPNMAFTRTSTSLSMSSADAAAKQSYNNIFVAGGSRGVGRHIISAVRAQFPESKITALVRSDEAVEELSKIENVNAVQGDAFDCKMVEGTIDGCDAVISTLGGTAAGEEGKRVDYEGNNNVIEAAGILGVTRVVLVTSIGCGDSQDAIPPSAYEVLKDALAAKTRAENVLIKYYTNTNWTIIRPGGLKSEPKTGTAVVTEDKSVVGSIHREDVAELVVKALTSPNSMRKILSAVDPELMEVEKSQIDIFELN